MSDEHDINLPEDADDLGRHAPTLFSLKGKEEGFVVPALYFEELSELVVLKTSIPEDGGLVVPEKYFEELPSLIEAKTIIPTDSGLTEPHNYFEELPEIIEAKTIIPEESGLTEPLNYFEELPSLIEAKTTIPAESGLTEPGNYFEEFHSNLESKIALESIRPESNEEVPADYFMQMESELHVHIALDNVKQDEGFVVPEGYFSNLTEKILEQVSVVRPSFSTSLETGSAEVDNENDPNIPSGYFDALPDKLIARLEDEGEIKHERGRIIVFAEWTKKYARPAAVAASAALLIGLSWFFLANKENNSGDLMIADHKGIVPDRIIHVVPPIENVIRREAAPEGIANNIPNESERIKPNVIPQVILNEDEIIAHSDLMDESMVMDFIAESNMVEPTEEVMDESMMEYLMNDNAGFDVFDPGDK